ncbi:MAG: hypothetical protein AB7P02_04975 [Alphaproteobacteria bacterium]
MANRYDRKAEDLGNIIALEHVNVQVQDQLLATVFYISGIGLTRDPFLMTGVDNMWANVGRSQFHLITGKPQVLRGRVGLVVPDREALLGRLAAVQKALSGTRFAFSEAEGWIDTTCPWGNRIRCHTPDPRFGRITLGMPYVEFDVPRGTADGIARFYSEIVATPSSAMDEASGRVARVAAGMAQELVFRETDAPIPDYDGHHIQVYVADFSGPHARLDARGLVSEESNQHQYRFEKIVDLDTGAPLFVIEHEVRSLRHPLYARPLVNRNAAQSNRNYAPGHDGWIPEQTAVEMDDPRARMRGRA